MPRKRTLWFRFYVEAVHDRKLRRQDPAVRWLWVAVLAIARQSPTPGTLLLSAADDEGEPVDEVDLADVAALDVATVKDGLAEFERLGMLTRDEDGAWVVAKWSERQFESDDTTQRTRKHRSKEQDRNVPTSFPGTPSSRARATEAETEAETEKPIEPRKRARQLPNDWQPNPTHQQRAKTERLDLTRETEKFTTHHRAKGTTYKDWDQAFTNWLIKATEYARPNGRATTSERQGRHAG